MAIALLSALAVLCAQPHSPTGAGGSTAVGTAGSTTSSHAPTPAGCGADAEQCGEQLVGADGRWTMRVYRNFPLSGSAVPTRAVVVIHGTGRNAQGYFAGMLAAARKAGVAARTMVIAPWLKTGDDHPVPGEAYWINDAWKSGQGAVFPPGLSSFSVLDELLATLAEPARFPNLRAITLAGHSAGGQFTQRYAALGLAPNSLRIPLNYVPANPSSYLYFGPARPADTASGFAIPTSGSCPDFNDYKYGMDHRSGYPAQLSAAQAFGNYINRPVTLINGAADTVDDGDMDTTCAAMLQGPNRAARGANYFRLIHTLAPNSAHTRIVLAGVAHDADAVWANPRVWGALFGVAAAPGPGNGGGFRRFGDGGGKPVITASGWRPTGVMPAPMTDGSADLPGSSQ